MKAVVLALLLAQRGDKPGEAQPPLSAAIKIPPSPVVPPDRALKTFQIASGFRIDQIACEPLVEDPVRIAFDAEGRLWVVEMRGYMPTIDGRGEKAPTGKIAVLEDTDGDGRMDKRTVFLDGLVMPRAIGFAAGGVLVAEPPRLLLCRDTDGDLACDQKEVVDPSYAAGKGNPEHLPNGLVTAIDNWIYSAKSRTRYRLIDGEWVRATTRFRGQWGLAQDDWGQLYYNKNDVLLQGDLDPVHSPEAHRPSAGALMAGEGPVWPIRVCTGVNRGYRPVTLRPDGTLRIVVSSCSPLIYRGGNFPEEFGGNAFVCEPAGNLVKRLVIKGRVARDAYKGREFLASTDERFRPVDLCLGPDGCLYVADFYRGIIQHGAYMTTFLRDQIRSRDLDKPVGLGRIYRISMGDRKAADPSKDPVRHLSHPNGWVRDTAQRLIAERGDLSMVPALQYLAVRGAEPLGRFHALFALEGLGKLDPATVAAAEKDPHPRVRRAATLLREGGAVDPIDLLVFAATKDASLAQARLDSMSGREIDFVERVMAAPAWEERKDDRQHLLRLLAGRAVRDGKIRPLLDLIAVQAVAARWRQKALLEGMIAARPAGSVRLASRSAALIKLCHSEDESVRRQARSVFDWVEWNGKKDPGPPPRLKPMSDEMQARFARGRQLYVATCAACHRLSGLGEEGKGPPLVDSEWVLGPEERLVRILVNGLIGPVTVKEKKYAGAEMPALMNVSSEEIAAILTYARREWGHRASPVDTETVRRIRSSTEDRVEPWTEAELLGTKVERREAGKMDDGRIVHEFIITNESGLEARVITYGATLTAVKVPDRTGRIENVTLHLSSPQGYLAGHPLFGSVVGRYANRIEGASFTLDGKKYAITKNSGPNHIHGGRRGFQKMLWEGTALPDGVRLTLTSPDGEEGYPGKLQAGVSYRLTNENELRMEYVARTDKPTHVNLTNHAYWNLGGADSGPVLDHVLTLNADRYLPAGDRKIPTGEQRPVDGTPMDFRKPMTIGSRIDQVKGGYDHCYVLNKEDGKPLVLAARVEDPKSGRVMEVFATQPGVQLYTANGLRPRKGRWTYGPRHAFCLETQHFPDTPNKPGFPTTVVRPGKTYRHVTVHRFSVSK